ncbi:MAG: transcriptional regulator [Candidatus Thermoplasmatota archaeon]|nr:transcriptional regulator [Candidatus Thermoplasmatota archaeon]MBU4071201.1 transcriptional regulator [Candidatus Thermoplasmatota archaeon]MBU4592744.1 transcriptional regulator [Candidatus Thermoplasmatota archaeon]
MDLDFEITLRKHTPLTAVDDLEEACEIFLTHIGYFGPRSVGSGVRKSIPFRLFVNCFLKRKDKVWQIKELAHELITTQPTVGKYVNNLKAMSIIEESAFRDDDGKQKKGYRLRYGNLKDAWHFVEENVNVSMANYRKSVDHIQNLADEKKR